MVFLLAVIVPAQSLFSQQDSLEYVKADTVSIRFKKINAAQIKLTYAGIKLKQLLDNPSFTYKSEHHVTTRNGFLIGWYFRFNDQWGVNVYFPQRILEDKDNVYLHDLKLDDVKEENIRRIEVVKRR
jgi:hypothetical protein